jgi:hypothetical protein
VRVPTGSGFTAISPAEEEATATASEADDVVTAEGGEDGTDGPGDVGTCFQGVRVDTIAVSPSRCLQRSRSAFVGFDAFARAERAIVVPA